MSGERPRRVTFCTFDYPGAVAGPNSWLQRLAPALRDAGDEVRLLVRQAGDPAQCPTLRHFRELGLPAVAYPWPADTRAEVRTILRELRDNPPDVFVPNLIVGALYAGSVVRRWGIPTVGVVHSDDPFYRQGMRERFVSGSAAFRLSALVCVSRYLYETFAAQAPADLRLAYIPCGVPRPARVARFPRAEEPFRIVYAGRLVQEQKRILDVVSVLREAVRVTPGCEAVIYGDGPERAAVLDAIAGEGRVRWGGSLSPCEMAAAWTDAHAVLSLSDYEGLPISLLEAMAAGAVPICFDIPSGIREVLRHEANGFLVADRGPSVLSALRALRENPERWAVLSATARATIDGGYTDAQCAARWRGLLHDSAPARARRPPALPSRIRLPPPHPAMGGPHADARRRPALLRAARRILRGLSAHIVGTATRS